ncbi:unnamed protein product [Sphagnum troendelagicum]
MYFPLAHQMLQNGCFVILPEKNTLNHVYISLFKTVNSQRKLGKLVVEMAEVQNCMSWLVPLMLCDLQVIQPCSASSTSSTCYWVMEAQCAPGFASWGAGTYCLLSPYGLNFC